VTYVVDLRVVETDGADHGLGVERRREPLHRRAGQVPVAAKRGALAGDP